LDTVSSLFKYLLSNHSNVRRIIVTSPAIIPLPHLLAMQTISKPTRTPTTRTPTAPHNLALQKHNEL